jgi:hypothetical protein
MDPRDGLHSPGGGVDCAVCGRPVPLDRIRVLARREDISFVEIDCHACRSESLGIVVAGDRRAAAETYGEFLPADDARFREAHPIDADDVLAVHELLRRGDLTALVGGADATGAGSEA